VLHHRRAFVDNALTGVGHRPCDMDTPQRVTVAATGPAGHAVRRAFLAQAGGVALPTTAPAVASAAAIAATPGCPQ
jgi:hypothetical protein